MTLDWLGCSTDSSLHLSEMSQENSDLITLTNTILGYGLVTEIIFLFFFFFFQNG